MKKKLLLQDFSEYLVKSEGINKKDADKFVRSFFEVIEEGLLEDKFVKIKGFGTFKLVSVSERESVNINTGERFMISEHTKVSFTPDTTMKDLVNRPFAHFEAVDLNEDIDMKEFEIVDEEMMEEEEGVDDTTETSEEETAEDRTETERTQEEPQQPLETASTEEKGNTPVSPHPMEPTPITNGQSSSTPTAVENAASPSPQSKETSQPETEPEQAQPIAPQPTAAESLHPQTEMPTTPVSENQESTGGHAEEEEVVVTPTQPIINPNVSNSQQTESTNDEACASQPENHSNATMGYTYTDAPMPRKQNWWKTSAILLGIVLLMFFSYFAGYFRIFCPCSIPFIGNTWDNLAPTPAEEPQPIQQPKPQPTDSIAKQRVDSVKAQTPATTTTEKTAPKAEEAQATKDLTPQPQTEKTTTAKSQDKVRPATHRVKMGDNVYRIARRYYGSDSYAQRIIEANHLKDANTITIGMELKLP